MKNLEQKITAAIGTLYGEKCELPLTKTRREFAGDVTLVVFPLLKASRKSPEATAMKVGECLMRDIPEIKEFNVVKGFLNLTLTESFWMNQLAMTEGFNRHDDTGRTVMVEYSSPNTNKPLHLGHVRNNLLGYSVAQILEAAGNRVVKVNLVNDRGIHICKSMLAWQLYGNGETPASSGMKGDHLVGKYYVEFNNRLAEDPSLQEKAQEMLRKWEARDPEVYALWETMNGWVYEGFDVTYKALGVSFDKIYYESQTYLLGKSLVEEGLAKGIFYRKEDGSVWIDLTADGLDEKLLLRGDGTSVYMTQDLGTAVQRFSEEKLDQLIYVVGNEQNYHFQVLKLILSKLCYAWSDAIHHLSYGMVELPEGKMKSREGTVVDADDLIDGMIDTARRMSEELGKLDGVSPEEAAEVSRRVGLGALKYFLLKVDPKKTMLFDPKESIDFNGNTGPFIQYTHARICSILRKGASVDGAESKRMRDEGPDAAPCETINAQELELVKLLTEYPRIVTEAAAELSPAVVANYGYELAKTFNGFYHDCPILREEDAAKRDFRLRLSRQVARTLCLAMGLLGIELPEKM